MTRRVISILSLAGFLAVAVFGLAVMSHTMGHGNCVASVAQGVACPLALSTGSFLALHANFYLTLTSAALILVLFGVALFVFPRARILPALRRIPGRSVTGSHTSRPRDIARWFALLETSPTLL